MRPPQLAQFAQRRQAGPTIDLTKSLAPLDFTKADGDKGDLAGYASKFWEVDSYGEATAPGAFAKSIKERGPDAARNRIHFRYEHAVTVGKHTSMKEDDVGLAIEAHVVDDTQDGTRLRKHLQAGIQYGISIGFRRIKARPGTTEDPFDLSQAPAWLTENFDPVNVIVLEEVKLMENSAVSFPAVDSALVDSYRSAQASIDQIEQLLQDLRAGEIAPEQRSLLERLAVDLPAALAPESREASPRKTTDSEIDSLLLELSMAIATQATRSAA